MVPPFWAVTAEDWKWQILGVSEVHEDVCRPSGGEKPRHGETRSGRAYEIAISVAVRQHHTGHWRASYRRSL